ncbi:MAG: hypothetical protein V2A79_20410, partial [Planctomycetota bacterium]
MKTSCGKGGIFLAALLAVFALFSQSALPGGKEINEIASAVNRQDGESPGKSPGTVEVRGGLVFLDVRDMPLTGLLAALAAKTGIAIAAGTDIKETVSLKLSGATLEDVLRHLCRNRALVYQHLPDTNSYRILSAALYESGQESRKPETAARMKTVAPGPA